MTYVDTARGEFSRTFKVLVAGASLCSGLALSLWATQQPELWKWLPAIFCFSVIGVVTLPGRFARPCGYFVASCVVALSLWALWLGLTGTESILGALLFAGLFGLPAARYLLFGVAPSPESGSPATQVHVVTMSSFEVEPGEDAQTNPGLYGRAFSKFVAEGLRARGEPVEAVIPEDFGWCVLLGKKPARRWVGCEPRGIYGGVDCIRCRRATLSGAPIRSIRCQGRAIQTFDSSRRSRSRLAGVGVLFYK